MKIPYVDLTYKNKSKKDLIKVFKKVLDQGQFVGGDEIDLFEKKNRQIMWHKLCCCFK